MVKDDIYDKVQKYITHFIRLTLIVVIIAGLYNQRWYLTFTTLIILFVTYAPYFIKTKYKIYLPTEYEFIIIVFLYASLFLGEIRFFYLKYWWWDTLLHLCSGIGLGFAGFLFLYIIFYKNQKNINPIWLSIFAFCFALSLGALWEIFEFTMDSFFSLNMQKSGLVDTMWDLIADSIGALITSFVGYYYFKGKRWPFFERLFDRFIKRDEKIKKDIFK